INRPLQSRRTPLNRSHNPASRLAGGGTNRSSGPSCEENGAPGPSGTPNPDVGVRGSSVGGVVTALTVSSRRCPSGTRTGADRSRRPFPHYASWSADQSYPLGLRTLRALRDLELHPLAVVERLVAIHLNGREVNEDVFAAVHGDEAVTLLAVEPFDRALCHAASSLCAAGAARGSAGDQSARYRSPAIRAPGSG